MIKNIVEKGINLSEISRQIGMGRKTVKKYGNSRDVPLNKYCKRTSKLDPHKNKIKDLIEKYNLSIVRISEEIRNNTVEAKQYLASTACRLERTGE